MEPQNNGKIVIKLQEPVEHLRQRMEELHQLLPDGQDGYAEEFNSVEKDSEPDNFFNERTSAKKAQNRTKNRYSNVLPYEKTRVILHEGPTDYINANYVDGEVPGSEKAYIATQGPLEGTVVDFWRMVWQENSIIVVMLTRIIENDRGKCHRYYPKEKEKTKEFPPFKITLLEKEPRDKLHRSSHGLIKRKFKLENSDYNACRDIYHFQYTEWPDHGLPASTAAFTELLHCVDGINGTEYVRKSPIVVHCSAGIGRTGTFCTVHSTLRKLHYHIQTSQDANSLNVKELIRTTVLRLRKSRFGMVQTKEQFQFCYMCLYEALEEEEKLERQNSSKLVSNHVESVNSNSITNHIEHPHPNNDST